MPNAEPVGASRSAVVNADAIERAVEKAIANAVLAGDFEKARALADKLRELKAEARREVLGKGVIDFIAATRVMPRRKAK